MKRRDDLWLPPTDPVELFKGIFGLLLFINVITLLAFGVGYVLEFIVSYWWIILAALGVIGSIIYLKRKGRR